ncbi:MAG: hypothetical protein WCG34_11290, partial [Leptolinea sp.]
SADLEEVLIDIVGLYGLTGPSTDVLNRLARTCQFLLDHLRAVTDSEEIEAGAAKILGMMVYPVSGRVN